MELEVGRFFIHTHCGDLLSTFQPKYDILDKNERCAEGKEKNMPDLIDISFYLDVDMVIRQVQVHRDGLPAELIESLPKWVGLPLERLPELDRVDGIWHWGKLRFQEQRIELPQGGSCLLLRQELLRERLIEAALDLMPDSIQLYGPDGSIQFFNRATKQLLDIPQEDQVEGQHLLDLFLVDEAFSTTLTALCTQMPVRNRFDCYKSTSGKDLATVNASYPVTCADGSLIGAVTLERDISMVRRQLPELQYIQRVLTSHLSDALLGEKNTRYTLDDLIGSSPQMRETVDMARQMSQKDINILIQGETGTGKELFAQGIHALSSQRGGKFVAVNCAAFPETLIEGMLFGTVKGAYTGSTDKAGLIEAANHGTLFLDELNSMSLPMQAKLLRVLEEGTLQRVGSTKDIRVDIRVLSACNQEVFALVEAGVLRRDLFYRLASAMVEIPPLRERMDDLEELVWYYVRERSSKSAHLIERIEPDFWESLRQYSWPGNVRELFHILECSVGMAKQSVLRRENLPVYFLRRSVLPVSAPASAAVSAGPELLFKKGLDGMVQAYERQVLSQAYEACGKNATRTAELLKISRQSFQYYRKKYGLN